MSKVGEEVLEDFFVRLNKASEVDDSMIQELKKALGQGNKPKADDLVAVFKKGKEQELP